MCERYSIREKKSKRGSIVSREEKDKEKRQRGRERRRKTGREKKKKDRWREREGKRKRERSVGISFRGELPPRILVVPSARQDYRVIYAAIITS